MKAILEFNLPEGNTEFRNAINGVKLRSVFWDFDQYVKV
jgi:hypothetical protein